MRPTGVHALDTVPDLRDAQVDGDIREAPGPARVDAEITDHRVQLWRLRTGDEVETAMGHTGWGRPEVAQDLPEFAGVRIDVLVVGNDLKRPDRVRGHVTPLARPRRGATGFTRQSTTGA